MARKKKYQDIIGRTTRYYGERKYLRKSVVRIVGIMRNCLRPDYDPDDDSMYEYIDSDEILNERGPVTKWDRVEVRQWIESEGRFSFVTADPRAVDLGCFQNLKK